MFPSQPQKERCSQGRQGLVSKSTVQLNHMVTRRSAPHGVSWDPWGCHVGVQPQVQPAMMRSEARIQA